MTKRFALTPELTCPELEGYKLPEIPVKTEFTRQDMINLVESLKDYTYESNNILGNDEREASEFVDLFLENRTPRIPIAIEVKMAKVDEYIPSLNPDGTVKGRWVYE